MIHFPLTVIDDVFQHPEQILELAKTTEYLDKLPNNYPGVVSKKNLQEIDHGIALYVLQSIFAPFYDPRDHQFTCNAQQDFQKITPYKDTDSLYNKGRIHCDHYEGQLATAIIYLNDCDHGGTTFWEKKKDDCLTGATPDQKYISLIKKFNKDGVVTDELEKKVIEHRNKFREVIRVEAKANRMVILPAEIWHSQTSFGYTNETRYTLRTFLTTAQIKLGKSEERYARWPMQRSK